MTDTQPTAETELEEAKSRVADEFIRTCKWSDGLPEWAKSLAIGNIRGFWNWLVEGGGAHCQYGRKFHFERAIGRSIEQAAGELPDGFELVVSIESGSAVPSLFNHNEGEHVLVQHTGELPEDIIACIAAAKSAAQ